MAELGTVMWTYRTNKAVPELSDPVLLAITSFDRIILDGEMHICYCNNIVPHATEFNLFKFTVTLVIR